MSEYSAFESTLNSPIVSYPMQLVCTWVCNLVCTVFTMDTYLYVLVLLYECSIFVFYFMCIINVWCAPITYNRNSIPLHIRQSQTYSSFRRHLKTYYFLSAYPAPSGPCNVPWFSSETLAIYKSLTYLLKRLITYLLTYLWLKTIS